MNFIYNDGGRSEAGLKGSAGDCGARAMAIALGMDYKTAYKELAQANKDKGFAKSARNGIYKDIYSDVLAKHGWVWVSAPTFKVLDGYKNSEGKVLFGRKARCSDMPTGTVIARQAGHYVAVIDGIPQDTWDCSQKMVYGYWTKNNTK
jgi:hypothetical protein